MQPVNLKTYTMEVAQAFGTLWADLPAIFSMVVTGFVGLFIVVFDAFKNDHPSIPWITGGALAVAFVWELFALGAEPGTAMLGMVRTGGYAAFINLIIVGTGLFSVVLSAPYLRRMDHEYGEVYAIILFATVGMILLGTANHLVSVFVGLETMSICLYILTGLVREDEGSVESALKYFLLGAFSTGFFLYGIALLYGATGTMYLPAMADGLLMMDRSIMFWAGVGLLLIGFMFKVGAAPFHMWTPDVYQGAPTTLTGYMAAASKAAAFGALILVLFYALPFERWQIVLVVLAAITMIVGNVLALSQTNVKRLLAYSSIAHVGYVLVGLAAGTAAGYAGALYYLLVYAVMNVAAFGVMAFLEWDGKVGRAQTLDSLAGIGYRKPLLGVVMGVAMFSLIGFPPLGGFFGKYAVFAPALDAGLVWLVILAVLMSAVSAYYYLRVLVVFYFKTPDDEAAPASQNTFPVPRASAAVLAACAVLLVVLGVFYGSVFEVVQPVFEQALQMAATP